MDLDGQYRPLVINIRISIRQFTADDAEVAAQLFFDTVRNGTAAHYGEAQHEAWRPFVTEIEKWRARLSGILFGDANRFDRPLCPRKRTSGW